MSRQGPLIKLIMALVIIALIVSYAVFNSRFLIDGPSIEIYDLVDGQIIEEDIVHVRGNVKNISFISLNGRQIFINEQGEFDEELLLTNRLNPIEIYAKDKFDKEVIEKLILIHRGQMPIIEDMEINIENATSTTTSTEE
jgi:hypothetical protein